MTQLMPTRSPTGMRFVDQIEGFPGLGEFDEASPRFPVERDLEKRLGGLDGQKKSYYVLVMLPAETDIDTMNRSVDASQNFLQCAGSAKRLTVEHIRPRSHEIWHDPDLGNVRDILGRARPDVSKGPEEHISMSGDREQVVYGEEVFTADEAVDIFAHFYRHGVPPPGLLRRTVEV